MYGEAKRFQMKQNPMITMCTSIFCIIPSIETSALILASSRYDLTLLLPLQKLCTIYISCVMIYLLNSGLTLYIADWTTWAKFDWKRWWGDRMTSELGTNQLSFNWFTLSAQDWLNVQCVLCENSII